MLGSVATARWNRKVRSVGSNGSVPRRATNAVNREVFGVLAAIIGAVMLFLGWYGVSGRPNLAEQMPYIASATVPGAALVIAASVLLMGSSAQRRSDQTGDLVAELHALLVEEVGTDPSPSPVVEELTGPDAPEALVAVAGTAHYHRPDCTLVSGKAEVERVDPASVEGSELRPCPVCEPTVPTTTAAAPPELAD
ncbi:MAG: hypothetical protein JWL72_3721 [Ilumatobacteraceae bacterium]|nr:hypothetical protein [Ilumatobacteraceae bacterium]MCU1390383.1 hypothetical protein [Ilumatobacteraceae bacterium]